MAGASLAATVTNYSTCPVITEETFKGILLGDVNGSYAAYTADGILKSEDGEIILDLENAIVDGSTVKVPVALSSKSPVNALDLAFMFNEDKLSFQTIEALNNGTDAEDFLNPNDRTFRFSANNMENFDLNSNVAMVTFESNDGTINKKDFNSTLGLLNGKPVQVTFAKSTSIANYTDVLTIFPNPSNGTFNVVLKETANVQIMDINGKILKEVGTVNANTKQAINLENVSAGVYLMRVSNEHFSSTQRIVIEK